jgi:hypothetical protein
MLVKARRALPQARKLFRPGSAVIPSPLSRRLFLRVLGGRENGRRMTMKANRVLGLVLAAGVGFVAAGASPDALAQSKTKPPAAKPAGPTVPAEPPMGKKAWHISPPGLAWGMNQKKVADIYDAVLEEDYKPKYKQASPGVQMKNLDAALAEEKAAFRRSRIDFGKLPTGVDSTPLRGEFTYLNRESIMSLTRNGETRYFFFINDRLWKLIDEIKLSDQSKFGKNYKESTEKFAAFFGVPGRVLPPDAAAGRFAAEVDWKDPNNDHIRVIQRSDTAIGMAIQDGATDAQLSSLRTNKPSADDGIDPAVKAATAGGPGSQPPPGPPDKGKDNKAASTKTAPKK